MNKMFKITGNEQDFPEFRQFHQLSSEFLPFAQKKLGFNKPVDINLVSDPENAEDPLGKTAYYDPNIMKITLFIDKRHVKDILRSLSHELVHHTQNCRGDFGNGVNIGEGNFTTNEALRELELEAYKRGSGEILREFEDYKKSMNESISYLLNDSFFLKNKKNSLKGKKLMNENNNCSKDEDCPDGHRCENGKCVEIIGCVKNCPEKKEGLKEEEKPKSPCGDGPPCKEMEDCVNGKCVPVNCSAAASEEDPRCKEKQNENWHKGNKDKLLFETLTKIWAK